MTRIKICARVVAFLPILFVFSLKTVQGFKYGPSFTWLASSPTVLKLDSPNQSILVPLVKNNVSAYGYELFHQNQPHWLWRENKVLVKAPKGFKIMIVIQMLNLSTGMDEELEKALLELGSTSCPESLQIYEKSQLVQETCGTVNYTNKVTDPKELVGPRTYLSETNSVRLVLQFASKLVTESLENWNMVYKKEVWNRKFSLAISLTAFKDCEEISPIEKRNYRPCYTSVHKNIEEPSIPLTPCIHSTLFCDGIMNCASSPGESLLGRDENSENCPITFTKLKNNSFEILSSFNSFRPNDHYHLERNFTTKEQFDERENFQRTDMGLGPSSTILLIVLTVLFVMILGLIIRLCCSKCVGNPLPGSRRCTAQSVGSWITPPDNSSADAYLPNFVVHSQCSRFEAGKDLPPAYEDLFPPPPLEKGEEMELQVDNPTFASEEEEMSGVSNSHNNDETTNSMTIVGHNSASPGDSKIVKVTQIPE